MCIYTIMYNYTDIYIYTYMYIYTSLCLANNRARGPRCFFANLALTLLFHPSTAPYHAVQSVSQYHRAKSFKWQ